MHCELSAAAKSLQLCPTLCDPIDGNPPGSSVPGILQARMLEWVAILPVVFFGGDFAPWKAFVGYFLVVTLVELLDRVGRGPHHPALARKTPQHRIFWPQMSIVLRLKLCNTNNVDARPLQ